MTQRPAQVAWREANRDYQNEYRQRRRVEAITALGGRCEHCGEDDPVVLDIDHREPGERIKHRNAWPAYKDIRDGITDPYQLLCCNCHRRKTLQNGDHRHRHAVNN